MRLIWRTSFLRGLIIACVIGLVALSHIMSRTASAGFQNYSSEAEGYALHTSTSGAGSIGVTDSQAKEKKNSIINDTNAKLIRDTALTLGTFTLGYYAVCFQIKPNVDKHGHKYQQENHLHVLAAKKRIRSLQYCFIDSDKALPRTAFQLPGWIFSPIWFYFLTLIISTAVYFFFLSSKAVIWFLFLTVWCSLSLCVSIIYVYRVICMLYGNNWLYKQLEMICDEAKLCFSNNDTHEEKHVIFDECIREATSALYAAELDPEIRAEHCVGFFSNLIKEPSIEDYFGRALDFAAYNYSTSFEPALTCLIQLVTACCISVDGDQNVTVLLDKINSLRLEPNYPKSGGLLIVGICTLEELKRRLDEFTDDKKSADRLPDFRRERNNIEACMDLVYEWMVTKLYYDENRGETVLSAYKQFVLNKNETEVDKNSERLNYIRRYYRLKYGEISARRHYGGQ